jgi:hypothetical protein
LGYNLEVLCFDAHAQGAGLIDGSIAFEL